jgi:hypothetical protein
MEKLLEMLKANLLTEEQQEEVKMKLQDIIDLQVQDKLNEAMEKEKESLIELYEQKFEEYKTDTISKFSDFVDTILEEELEIPENLVEFARQGELYADLINEFKTRIGLDECALEEEAKSLLKEARDEIVKLRDELNELTSDMLDLKKDNKEFAAEIYKREKCDGLTETQREQTMRLLEGITSQKEIDRKFEVIKKHYLGEVSEKKDDVEDDEDVCECGEEDCEKCKGKKMSEGHAEVKTEKPDVAPTGSPFDDYKKGVLKVLKENKF